VTKPRENCLLLRLGASVVLVAFLATYSATDTVAQEPAQPTPEAKAARPEGGATTVEAAVQKLTGGTSREWIFQFWTWGGGGKNGPECSRGSSYRFYADHRLIIEKCENGRSAQTTHDWSIAQEGPRDIVITIGGKRYNFLDSGEAYLMRLQTHSCSKRQPTTVLEFRLSPTVTAPMVPFPSPRITVPPPLKATPTAAAEAPVAAETPAVVAEAPAEGTPTETRHPSPIPIPPPSAPNRKLSLRSPLKRKPRVQGLLKHPQLSLKHPQ